MRILSNVLTGTCCLIALSSVVTAADLPDAGRLLRESAPPPFLAPPQKQPLIEAPAEEHPKQLSNDIRVLISGFTYSGNTVFTAEELDRIRAPAAGRELTLAELEQAVDRITQAYRNKGYFLATAAIPPQALRPGQPVRVEILEGKLEKINLKTSPAETRTARSVLERYRDRLAVGKPADADSLTETVLLLNELPAIKSRVLLEPGTEPGGTAATLEVTEGKPYEVSLSSDNYGNYATGYYRVGAGLELYSPFRLGDQLSIRGNSSTSGDTQSAGIGWSVPVSSSGTRISLDYSWVRYELGRGFKSLDANGDAHGFSLTITQPLVRKGDLFVNAVIGGTGRLLDDRVDSAGTANTRHTAGASAGLSLYATDCLLGGGYTSFNVTYAGGTLGIDDDASRAYDQGPSGLHAEGAYNKISGGLSRTQTVYGNLSLFASLTGQWGDKNLDSSEQFSLGGPFAVRAYPVGEASADLGMVTTAELRYLLPNLEPLPGRVQLAALFDHGYGEISAKPLPGTTRNLRHLYGAGFGVNWQWNELVSLRTSVAWRMGELPTSDNTTGEKPTVYFQAMVRY